MAEEPVQQGTRLTIFGKLLSVLFILAVVALGAWIVVLRGGLGGGKPGGGGTGGGPEAPKVEEHDTASITTVKDWKFVPGDRLPAVKGASKYKWDDKDKTLIFTYNVWAGWLPVIAANHGTKPNTDSVFFKKYGFKVEMKLMDDPVQARDAFAAGEAHTLWGTVDMMVLFAPELMKDSRTAPRIVQQIDWSNGGDGIVTRKHIKTVADLKGKTIVYAQNSPSEYYVTWLLLTAGMKPSDIKAKYTATAFEAAAAFVGDKSIDGCVSWAPDIYNIADRVADTRILSSTKDASKVIADVYAVRADFAKDHPDIVEGLVAGIFEGMDMVAADPAPACQWMAQAFNMKADEVMGMRNDAHPTNFAENAQFLLNASNPTNFERTWSSAAYVYGKLGRLAAAVPFDQVMDFTYLQNLQKKGTFAHHKDESAPTFTPGAYKVGAAEAPIVTATVRINFYPNSANPYEPARDAMGNPTPGKLYDPNVDKTLGYVAEVAARFPRCVVQIEGHTDSSMKGRVPEQAVKDLSLARAEAIKQALIEKHKFDPNKFLIKGTGWDRPFDSADAMNQALNRRVEIGVFPPEQN